MVRITGSPAGCVPLQAEAALGSSGGGQTCGPGFHRLDYSLFKAIKINERFSVQFRAEFFNILNHPNFNAPGFGGNGVVSVGGSTNSPIRTSAKLDPLAMLPTIRGRSSLL